MRQVVQLCFFYFLCSGWLMGCQTNKGSVPPAVSQLPSVVLSPTVPLLATAPSTSLVATLLPSPTSTPSPIPLPTLLPTLTATATPFVNGEIYFLWNPEKLPEELGLHFPLYHLYRAIPSHEKGQWEIEAILTDLEPGSVFLSPDQTHLAIINSHTKDDAYRYPTQIDIFSLQSNQVEFVISMNVQIDNGFSVDDLFWMPDGQTIIYAKNSNLFSVSLESPEVSLPLTNNPPYPTLGNPFKLIQTLTGSSMGNLLALNILPGIGVENGGIQQISLGDIYVFSLQTHTFSLIKSNIGSERVDLALDPTEQWLAFTGERNLGLWLVELNTMESVKLVDSDQVSFPVWSPDKHWLTFNDNLGLYFWDNQTQIIKKIVSGRYFSRSVWSPNGEILAVGIIQEGETHLVLINNTVQIVLDMPINLLIASTGAYKQQNPFVWAPDEDWILFPTYQADSTGFQYHIIEVATGEIFPFIDTRETNIAYDFLWVPTSP